MSGLNLPGLGDAGGAPVVGQAVLIKGINGIHEPGGKIQSIDGAGPKVNMWRVTLSSGQSVIVKRNQPSPGVNISGVSNIPWIAITSR